MIDETKYELKSNVRSCCWTQKEFNYRLYVMFIWVKFFVCSEQTIKNIKDKYWNSQHCIVIISYLLQCVYILLIIIFILINQVESSETSAIIFLLIERVAKLIHQRIKQKETFHCSSVRHAQYPSHLSTVWCFSPTCCNKHSWTNKDIHRSLNTRKH